MSILFNPLQLVNLVYTLILHNLIHYFINFHHPNPNFLLANVFILQFVLSFLQFFLSFIQFILIFYRLNHQLIIFNHIGRWFYLFVLF